MPKVAYEDRNRYQITAGQMAHRKKMINAKIELYDAIVGIEQKYSLTILEVLRLLHQSQEDFLRAGEDHEAKERWDEEQEQINGKVE